MRLACFQLKKENSVTKNTQETAQPNIVNLDSITENTQEPVQSSNVEPDSIEEKSPENIQPNIVYPDNITENSQEFRNEIVVSNIKLTQQDNTELLAVSSPPDGTSLDILTLSSWEPSSEETARLQQAQIIVTNSQEAIGNKSSREDIFSFTENSNLSRDEQNDPDELEKQRELLDSDAIFEENSVINSIFPLLDESLDQVTISTQENSDQISSCNTAHTMENERGFEMWWYDAFERRSKGHVYLFGKQYEKSIDDYTSCCVLVKNIQREIYVLPRVFKMSATGEEINEAVHISDVKDEIQTIFASENIKSWEAQVCTRKYVFGLPNIPSEAEYLKINYSYEDPELPNDLTGKTFLHIFGLTTSPLERFIMERKVMGPGWIVFENAVITDQKQSWSKINATVNSPSFCEVIESQRKDPPLKILSIKCQTSIKGDELLTVSGILINKDLNKQASFDSPIISKFSVIRLLTGTSYPSDIDEALDKEKIKKSHEIRLECTEPALLSYLIAKINRLDPDIIVGHNVWNNDLNMLLHKFKKNNTSYWHKLGKLQLESWPKISNNIADPVTYEMNLLMSGRLVCDLFLASKELVRCRSYDLSELAKSQLNIDRTEIDLFCPASYYQNSSDILKLINHGLSDAQLALSVILELQILSLSKQLTRLAGNLWSSSINGGAHTDRNDHLLYHAFYNNTYICPDKKEYRSNIHAIAEGNGSSQNENPTYSGGLVLEPVSGLYDKYVLLLDFNSLYPSIIQEYNMCFTTMNLQKYSINDDSANIILQEMGASQHVGILPKLIKKLVKRREQVKRAMEIPDTNSSILNQYDVEQKALKLTSNTVYGCLGSPYSRFYARPLAMSITSKGRDILRNTVDLVEASGMEVIYGDTDSIMIKTNEKEFSKVKELGMFFKQKVNAEYKKLQIDVEGYFKHTLLLKKKKYGATKVTERSDGLIESVEVKGLDSTHRNYCSFSQTALQYVLEIILSEKSTNDFIEDIYSYLKSLKSKVESASIPKKEFIIQKKLSKSPEDYTLIKKYPHVVVAAEMKRRGQIVRAGDFIQFIMCKNDNEDGQTVIPRIPKDVFENKAQINYEWYMVNQIIAPITRLYAPIDELSVQSLAEHIGVEHKAAEVEILERARKNDSPNLCLLNDPKRFKCCDKLLLECSLCETKNEFGGLIKKTHENSVVSGLVCTCCGEDMDTASVQVQVIFAARKYIKKYYQSPNQCDRPLCGFETKEVLQISDKCPMNECFGNLTRKFSERMLYTQLAYFSYLFDSEAAKKELNGLSTEIENAEKICEQEQDKIFTVRSELDKYIKCSGYRYLNFLEIM
ncbi:unnamed protein product [Rhizopus stolonifer]